MSGPLRRTLSLGVRAALRSPTTATASSAWESGVVAPVAARTREAAAFGGFRSFASESDDDFKPKVHVHGGGDVQAAIAEDVKDNRVVVYMKGTPDAPRCGFSNIVVQILNHQGVDFKAHDVLASEDLRNGIKKFTSWPTIPQVFIDGEFVGGCDIMKQMHNSGELNKVLGTNLK